MRSKGSIALVAVIVLLVIIGMAGCSSYNAIVQSDENVKQHWSNVESNYQRRADLIPNLVATVRGAAAYERETLESVIEARSRATQVTLSVDDLSDPERVRQFQAAQGELSGALSRLFAVSEQYPELRAVESFRDLQAQIEGTENRINTERIRYNEAVREYNSRVRTFPTVIFANMMGFQPRAVFEAQAGAERPPAVDFSWNR